VYAGQRFSSEFRWPSTKLTNKMPVHTKKEQAKNKRKGMGQALSAALKIVPNYNKRRK